MTNIPTMIERNKILQRQNNGEIETDDCIL
jgi:hypothetical protein